MSKSNKLTPKQEAFAQKYVECGNASEAYRFAYDVGECKDETIWCNACQLLADTKVTQRVDEIRQDLAKRNDVTLDKLNGELVESRDMARVAMDHSSMTTNTMAKAKLNGLIDKKDDSTQDTKLLNITFNIGELKGDEHIHKAPIA